MSTPDEMTRPFGSFPGFVVDGSILWAEHSGSWPAGGRQRRGESLGKGSSPGHSSSQNTDQDGLQKPSHKSLRTTKNLGQVDSGFSSLNFPQLMKYFKLMVFSATLRNFTLNSGGCLTFPNRK